MCINMLAEQLFARAACHIVHMVWKAECIWISQTARQLSLQLNELSSLQLRWCRLDWYCTIPVELLAG